MSVDCLLGHNWKPVGGTAHLKGGLQMVTCTRCEKPGWVTLVWLDTPERVESYLGEDQ